MPKSTYVAASSIHGLGLFAAKKIKKDSIIGWLESKPSDVDGCYVLWVTDSKGIEVLCDLKYINHSDRPNACYYDDLSVVALRDIDADEEITHNYGSADW